jgi:hypothetical protein
MSSTKIETVPKIKKILLKIKTDRINKNTCAQVLYGFYLFYLYSSFPFKVIAKPVASAM